MSLEARRAVGELSVPCTQYEVIQRLGAQEREGAAWVNRDVPGGTVHWEMKATEGGKVLMTFRVEVLEFAAK